MPTLILIVLLCYAGYSAALNQSPPIAPSPYAHFDEMVTYWEGRIRDIGPKVAYEEFVAYGQTIDVRKRHLQAHIFGDALYSQTGLEGASVCDARFFGGCMHQYMGRAVAEFGVRSISEFDTSCKGDFLCQHGMGHGLLNIFGYTPAGMKQALDSCHTLTDDTPILGCAGGVAMEYNIRGLTKENTESVVRPLGDDWLEPCNALNGNDATSCYFWQPSWWTASFAEKSTDAINERFKHISLLCRSLSNNANKNACISGTALSAVIISASRAIELCDLMYENSNERLICHQNVTNDLKNLTHLKPEDGCRGIGAEKESYCTAYVLSGESLIPVVHGPSSQE